MPASTRGQNWLLAVLLVVIASLTLLKPPEIWRDREWFMDGGLTLNAADRLLHGEKLFSDVFYQYGPVSIELYVLWSKVFGNSISSYQALNLLCMLLNCVLLFKVLQHAGLSISTIVVAFLALLPYFVAPDPAVFYYHFEKTLILVVVLLWRPPEQRSVQRSLALGCVIGLMQWVRFGAAAGVLAAVFILDLMLEKAFSRRLVLTTLSYVAGFFLVEGALAARFFVTLPKDVALETLWPGYMAGSYSVYAADLRYPRFLSLNYFIGRQLPIALCAVLAVGALFLVVRSKVFKKRAALLIPGLAFAAYCCFYYKQSWHYYIGSWLLILPAAAVIEQFSLAPKAIVAVLLLPALYLGLRADLFPSRDSELQAAVLPNGEKLWLSQEVINRNQALVNRLRELRDQPARRDVLFVSRTPVLWASHLYFFDQIPQPARHSMIFPGWLRPRDFQLLPATLDRSKAVVLLQDADQGSPSKDACQWESHPYPRPYCEQMTARLEEPIKVDDTCWIFPIRAP
jgi:hypothetical protein